MTPLLASVGIATLVVQSHYDIWDLNVVWWLAMACFVAHGIIALTRRDRRQFMALVAAQIVMLGLSVSSVLNFSHYLAAHGHG